MRIIKPEIERYAPALIRQHLTGLYGLDDLIIGGAKAGGTYGLAQNSIYMVHKNRLSQRVSGIEIKKTLHHEFSSMLMH
ncbi:MAG: hypothetical protein COC05_02460 [Gammaproteobacteria bacterium]|nr:MAG: hypothetical protein COC05_02460 [Gammaproteobacteria bacterium]